MNPDFNNKKIFVGGGAGFIGSNFIRHLLEAFPTVAVLNYDKLTYSGNLENLESVAQDSRYRFVRGDVANKAELHGALKSFAPDYIINFAAETHVDKSIHEGSEDFIRTNIWGVFNFLEYSKVAKGLVMLLQVSTDEVYGSLDLDSTEKFTESTAFRPSSPYSATKASGDLLCRAYHSTWGLPVVVTHCSNNFGPYQYPEKLIPFFITRMMGGKTLPLYGDGRHVRDWVYVRDQCGALVFALAKGKAGQVYNIGSGNEIPNIEIARRILKAFGKDDSSLEFVRERPGHDRRYALDASKIEAELGWKPETSFDTAFAQTIAWYMNNTKWIDDVRTKTGVFNAHIDL